MKSLKYTMKDNCSIWSINLQENPSQTFFKSFLLKNQEILQKVKTTNEFDEELPIGFCQLKTTLTVRYF